MRECDGCTACCDGWLKGQSYGHHFQPGRPCHFKCETGCSIYDKRPETPCQNYNCEWLTNYEIPEWMKPNIAKVIITKRPWTGGEYLEVSEMGEKIDSTILNWFFMYHCVSNIPVRIQVCGGWNNYGSLEFREEILNKKS